MRRVWQLKRLFVALGVLLVMALVVIGASAAARGQQQQTQTQAQQGDYAVVGLQESDSSGYHGLAVLRGSSSGNQTEVVIGLMSTGSSSGAFNFFGSSSASAVGPAGIYRGTCSSPGSEVASIGQPRLLPSSGQSSSSTATPSGTSSRGSSSTATPSSSAAVQVYVANGTVSMSLNSLLSSHYVIAVKSGSTSGATGTPSFGSATPRAGTASPSGGWLVCGQLSSTSSISTATPGGTSGTATGTPSATGTPRATETP